MPSALSPAETAAYIIKRDRAFQPIIRLAGPPPRRRNGLVDDRFGSLVRAITFQLLTTKAAGTIHGRVHDLCGDTVNVDAILGVGVDQLRSAGLSRTKAQAMIDLAQRVRDQQVQLSRHGRMSDVEILREVTTVRGIGPWTGQMYLMNTLARSDVWPVGDFGVRSGWSLLHGQEDIITENELREAGEKFVGVRSAVAWYCWEAVHFQRRAH
jgi:3-methyladenine DNA glycosylase/8-oxoguanine DNA glycosylase